MMASAYHHRKPQLGGKEGKGEEIDRGKRKDKYFETDKKPQVNRNQLLTTQTEKAQHNENQLLSGRPFGPLFRHKRCRSRPILVSPAGQASQWSTVDRRLCSTVLPREREKKALPSSKWVSDSDSDRSIKTSRRR